MSGFWSFKRIATGAMVATFAGGSFLFAQATRPAAAPPATAPAATQGQAQPQNYSLFSLNVNGKDVPPLLFYEVVMRVAGYRVSKELIDLTLAQKACEAAGIDIAGDKLNKLTNDEFESYLNYNLPLPADVKRDDRIRFLNSALAQRGLTDIEFQLQMQTQAYLRQLALGKVDVTDNDVKESYQVQYGEKRVVTLIPMPAGDADANSLAAKVRDQIEVKKKSPQEAANELQIGQIYPNQVIPKTAKGAPELVDVTFKMLTMDKPLSSVVTLKGANGQPDRKVLVYLEQIQPDTTKENPYDKVKEDTRARVKYAMEDQWMAQHLNKLENDAVLTTADPVLRQINEAIRSQAQAAATQQAAPTPPGTTVVPPATRPAPAIDQTLAPAGK